MELPQALKRLEPFFGQWYADKLLGKGGYGTVYQISREQSGCRQEAAMKWIAIPQNNGKTNAPRADCTANEHINPNDQDMKMIDSEISLMSGFRGNRHIVNMDDYGIHQREDGLGFDVLIRMELLQPLPEVQNSMTVDDAVRMGIDICRALEACAQKGVVHRDVKPSNIYRSPLGVYKLGDFGVAGRLETFDSALSRKGTRPYMAPEVWEGKPYDARVDLYALGIVLHMLLNANTIPFAAPSKNGITNGQPNELLVTRMRGAALGEPAQGSKQLRQVVVKACAYAPEDRFQTAVDMRRALTNCLGQEGGGAPLLPPDEQSVSNPRFLAADRTQPVIVSGECLHDDTGSIQPIDITSSSFGDMMMDLSEDTSQTSGDLLLHDSEPDNQKADDLLTRRACGSALPPDAERCTKCEMPTAFGRINKIEHELWLRLESSKPPHRKPRIKPRGQKPMIAQQWAIKRKAKATREQPSVNLSRVRFSAIVPQTFVKGEYSMIDIVMYEKGFRRIVDKLLTNAEEPVSETESGVLEVRKKAGIRIVLTSPDLEIDDNDEVQVWLGESLSFQFAVELPAHYAKRQILFTAAVYIDGVIATRLKFIAKCKAWRGQSVKVFREDVLSAFVSYASQDRNQVAMILQGIQKARPDLDLFFDVESLRSGDEWEPLLLAEIDKRDILFLCWSRFARESKWVNMEWRHAFEHKGLKGIEPVPIEPPELCPPPSELSKMHFNDKLLYFMDSRNSH